MDESYTEMSDGYSTIIAWRKDDDEMKLSAGLLLYRRTESGGLRLLIAHMGGPFWNKKDLGAWSIPKGEYEEGDDVREVAAREFEEEMGSPPPQGLMNDLGEVKQPSGKRIVAFALEADFDTDTVKSNTFTMEWPKGSGKIQEFPEIDRAEWVSGDVARMKLVKGQVEFVERLERLLGIEETSSEIGNRSEHHVEQADGHLSLF